MPAESNKNFWTESKYQVQQTDAEVKIMHHYEWSDLCMSVLGIIFTLSLCLIVGFEYLRVIFYGDLLNGYFVLFTFLYFSLMYLFLPLAFDEVGKIIKKGTVIEIDRYTLQSYFPFFSKKSCKLKDILFIKVLEKDNWLFLNSRIKDLTTYYKLEIHLKEGGTLILPFMDEDSDRINQLKEYILSPENFPIIEKNRFIKEDYSFKEDVNKEIEIIKNWKPKGVIKDPYFSVWDLRGFVIVFILVLILTKELNPYIAFLIPLLLLFVKVIHSYENFIYYNSKITLFNEHGITIKDYELNYKKAKIIKKEEIESVLIQKVKNKFHIKVMCTEGRLEKLPFHFVDRYNIEFLHEKILALFANTALS